jgi:hypothetical protein
MPNLWEAETEIEKTDVEQVVGKTSETLLSREL